MTTIAAVPYERKPTTLPDKHGTPVAVGDYVHLDQPLLNVGDPIVKVIGLVPVEAHLPDNVSKKLGTLSMEYSRFEIAAVHISVEPWPNTTGIVSSQRALSGVERVDMTKDQLRDRLAYELEIQLTNIDHRLAHFNGEKRRVERLLANLRE